MDPMASEEAWETDTKLNFSDQKAPDSIKGIPRPMDAGLFKVTWQAGDTVGI